MEISCVGSTNFLLALDKAINNVTQFDNTLAILLIEITWQKPRSIVTVVNECAKVLQQLKLYIRNSDSIIQIENNLFAIILPEIFFLSDAHITAERLIHSLEIFYAKGGLVSKPIISLSTAISGQDGKNANELFQFAKTKLQTTQFKVPASTVTNKPVVKTKGDYDYIIEKALGRAIENREFYLIYQPIFNLSTRRIVSWESLVRWRHPELAEVTAAIFLPLAHKAGLMPVIEDWVFVNMCENIKRWLGQGISLKRTFINLRAQQFENKDLIPNILEVLRKFKIEPFYLGIDIVDIHLVEDLDFVAEQIRSLQKLNVELNIDDFGHGYSSLLYFNKLPVSSFKIDRSLIANLPDDEEQAKQVKVLIDLAAQRGITITAKGIESYEQFVFLNQLGCQQGQGFFLCKPLPANEVTELIGRSHL